MNKRIIYPNDNGGVNVVVPTPDWISQEGNTIQKLAEMRVPEGKPYKIVDVSDIPSDRTFRDAWEYSE